MGINTILDAYYNYIYRPEGVDANTRGYAYRFATSLKAVKLTDLTDERVRDYLASIPARKPSAIRRDIVAIKAMLHYARKSGARFIIPVFHSPTDKERRVRFLTDQERERLLKEATGFLNHMRPLLGFMLYTGARPGEACNLKRRDINPIDKVCYLKTWKGGKERQRAVPLSAEAWKYIELSYMGCGPEEHLFRDSKGRPWEKREGDRYRRGYQIYEDWNTLIKRAKLTDFRPNDCRHDFATRIRSKNDLQVVSELLGHTSINTTQRYAHLGASDITRKAVEGLV